MERELYETEYKQLIVTKTDFNWLQVSSAYHTWLLKIIPSSEATTGGVLFYKSCS